MKAGRLTYKIEIYRPNIISTDYGNNKIEWEYHYSTRADVLYNSGDRTNENQEIVYPINRTFIIRSYVPVSEPMRIKFDDKYYQIISINPNKYHRNLEIYTRLVNE